jgi:hypothetical protein
VIQTHPFPVRPGLPQLRQQSRDELLIAQHLDVGKDLLHKAIEVLMIVDQVGVLTERRRQDLMEISNLDRVRVLTGTVQKTKDPLLEDGLLLELLLEVSPRTAQKSGCHVSHLDVLSVLGAWNHNKGLVEQFVEM